MWFIVVSVFLFFIKVCITSSAIFFFVFSFSSAMIFGYDFNESMMDSLYDFNGLLSNVESCCVIFGFVIGSLFCKEFVSASKMLFKVFVSVICSFFVNVINVVYMFIIFFVGMLLCVLMIVW